MKALRIFLGALLFFFGAFFVWVWTLRYEEVGEFLYLLVGLILGTIFIRLATQAWKMRGYRVVWSMYAALMVCFGCLAYTEHSQAWVVVTALMLFFWVIDIDRRIDVDRRLDAWLKTRQRREKGG